MHLAHQFDITRSTLVHLNLVFESSFVHRRFTDNRLAVDGAGSVWKPATAFEVRSSCPSPCTPCFPLASDAPVVGVSVRVSQRERRRRRLTKRLKEAQHRAGSRADTVSPSSDVPSAATLDSLADLDARVSAELKLLETVSYPCSLPHWRDRQEMHCNELVQVRACAAVAMSGDFGWDVLQLVPCPSCLFVTGPGGGVAGSPRPRLE